jgi:hypothetical protein
MEKKKIQEVRTEKQLQSSATYHRFPIDFMFLTPGLCESLRRLRKLTMGIEQDFCPFPLLLVHLCFCCSHSGGQSERGDRNKLWSRRHERNLHLG